MRHTVLASFVLLGAASAAIPAMPAAASAPAPVAAVPPSKSLDFKPTEMRLYRDAEAGVHYWYLTYTVTNKTGKDQRFAPRIEMVNDDGKTVALGQDVPSRVVRDLKKLLNDPLVEDQFSILGDLLQGEENAKTGLLVFRVPSMSDSDRKVGSPKSQTENFEPVELTVYVQGLSAETKTVPHPKTGEPVRLRANLPLTFQVPGDPTENRSASYSPTVGEWIFR